MADDLKTGIAVHRIRLRGPWHYQPLSHSELLQDGELREYLDPPLPPSGTMRTPGDWSESLGSEFRGRVAMTRRFGRPLNLSVACRLFLTLDGVDARARLWLNGELLGIIPWGRFAARFELPFPLQPRNELRIEIDCPAMPGELAERYRPRGRDGLPGGLTGDVALEIHETPSHG
jgi:hypothetical protein